MISPGAEVAKLVSASTPEVVKKKPWGMAASMAQGRPNFSLIDKEYRFGRSEACQVRESYPCLFKQN